MNQILVAKCHMLQGFRLVAMSKLPVGGDTLVYGSGDGGYTVYASDERMNKVMEAMAKVMT